jgi:hypothetical protein
MAHSDHFLQLYDKDGALYAVMLSAEFWQRHRARLEPQIQAILESDEPTERPEPMHEWEELLKYWDFKYPVNAEVECLHCGAKTSDWLHDPNKPFRLKGANIGGLVVFTCKNCGVIVRKKHFKDHMCYEYSEQGCGCR